MALASTTMLAATTLPRLLPGSSYPYASLYLQPRGSSYCGNGCRARNADLRCRRRLLTARGERPPPDDEDEEDQQDPSSAPAGGFDAAVSLFNRGEYHACHDVVEDLWYGAEDPARTLLHGVLQCAVGFHHLFNQVLGPTHPSTDELLDSVNELHMHANNRSMDPEFDANNISIARWIGLFVQNHRGAMMELGEGLCKLRKLNLDDDDPFSRFREEVADVLQFLYRTQKELAACTDYLCLTMDGSPSSYQLLGNFAAGQQLYRFEADDTDNGASSIIFSVSDDRTSQEAHHRVKLPTLHATEQNLTDLQCAYQHT
ncbi:hypothetical protein C2845_PM18G14470 [Panicum miliaceum]|uniref:Uncharacterized protein n=1 Tax=Panicum miliaceum TaxID=4540 RepID=A0A3L6PI78_PANMI|nr:hypothetical protein C2845_PM18G14470 [Panicum miliaceum]